MSYGSTKEGGGGRSRAGVSDGDFEDVVNLTKSHIKQINNATNKLSKVIPSIGTGRDTASFRDSIRDLNAQTNLVVKDTRRMLMDASNRFASSDRGRRMMIERLQRDLKEASDNNGSVQKTVISALKMSLNMAASEREREWGGDNDRTGLLAMSKEEASDEATVQVYADLQERGHNVEVDIAVIAEREERIQQLERDMIIVNDIMRDMAGMVHQQGDLVDDIEANVERTRVHAEDANQNLLQARKFQAKARNKLCLLIFILGIIAAVLVLIIVLSLK